MAAPSVRWTTRDLEAIPDDGGWKRYEIIDGELHVTRAPHARHQGAAGKLHVCLGSWSEETGLGVTLETPGVIFTSTDAVIPDLIWISRDRFDNNLDDAGHLTVAPEIVVEILSAGEANQRRDKEIKLGLYARHGVCEYWIVSWQQKSLEVYRRTNDRLQLASTLFVGDVLTSPLLPGFSAPIDRIFL